MYAVVADSEKGNSYPLAHLVAESRTVPTIAHFLAQLGRDYKLVRKTPFSPPRVVMDCSWALMHAVAESIKTTLNDHLVTC